MKIRGLFSNIEKEARVAKGMKPVAYRVSSI
jgi:hypothetical protein